MTTIADQPPIARRTYDCGDGYTIDMIPMADVQSAPLPDGDQGEDLDNEIWLLMHDEAKFTFDADAAEPPPAAVEPPAVEAKPEINLKGHKRVELTLASSVKSAVPTWAWTYDGLGRIQRGTLAVLAGRPGAGKSNAARWFAAGYSTGTLTGCWHGQPVNVAYISPGEESRPYVIKPGLDAIGADTGRIVFPLTLDDEGNPTRLLSASHRDILIESFRAADIRVVIVDPIMSTIPGTTNINQNNETRSHIEPWAQAAEAIDGIVLGICHFVKSPRTDLVAAINGSSAFGEVARAVFAFAKDRNSGQRVMSQVKNSTGVEDLSLLYEIGTAHTPTDSGGEASVAAFTITGRSTLTAADVMDANADSELSHGPRNEAQMWLQDYLEQQGRARSKDVLDDGHKQGHHKNTLYRAAKRLGVEVDYQGFPRCAYWKLPVSWYQNVPPATRG